MGAQLYLLHTKQPVQPVVGLSLLCWRIIGYKFGKNNAGIIGRLQA